MPAVICLRRARDCGDTVTVTAAPVINDLKVAFFKNEPHNISRNKFGECQTDGGYLYGGGAHGFVRPHKFVST